MPSMLELNASKISYRFDQVSSYIGVKGGFKGFCAFVRELNSALNIPESFSDLGLVDVDLEKLTHAALKDPSCGGNPVKLNDENVAELIKNLL